MTRGTGGTVVQDQMVKRRGHRALHCSGTKWFMTFENKICHMLIKPKHHEHHLHSACRSKVKLTGSYQAPGAKCAVGNERMTVMSSNLVVMLYPQSSTYQKLAHLKGRRLWSRGQHNFIRGKWQMQLSRLWRKWRAARTLSDVVSVLISYSTIQSHYSDKWSNANVNKFRLKLQRPAYSVSHQSHSHVPHVLI